MPDIFDQVAPQQQAPAPKAAAPQGDIFDQVAPQSQGQGTSQHGALYNAANTVLNTKTPDIPDGGTGIGSLFNPTDQGQGVLKGALSTAAGLGSVFNKVTGSNQPFNQDNLKDLTEGHTMGQSAGKGVEQVGEFATGEGAAAKGLSKLPLGAEGLSVASKTLGGAGVSAAQSGGDPWSIAASAIFPSLTSSPVLKAGGNLVAKTLGLTTGAGEDAIKRAFLNPNSSGLSKVMRGEWNVNDVIGNFQDSVRDFRDTASAKYKADLKNVTAQSIKNWPVKVGGYMQRLNNNLSNQLKDFGITQEADGSYNFRHAVGLDPGETQNLINTVRNWGVEARDYTPSGLDKLKQELGEYVKQDGRMKAFATRLYADASKGLNAIIPGYEKMTGDYYQAKDLLNKMESEFNVTPGSNMNAGTVSRKLQYLYKQGTDYRKLLMDKLPNGQDLLDQVAGLHLNTLAPKGLQKALIGAQGTWIAMTHGAGMANPASVVPTLAASSPRVVGEGARVAGKISQHSATPAVGNTLRRGLLSGIANSQQGN